MSDEEMATNAGPSAGPSAPASDAPVLSKKAQKRAKKQEQYQAIKLEKRQAERARRRQRAQQLKSDYAAGKLSAEEMERVEKQREAKRARAVADRGEEADVWGGAIVVDLGFDELMTEQEITSMHSQLRYVYSVNRTAKRPFAAVVHTSFSPEASPRLWSKMGKAEWQKWNRMCFMGEDVGELAGKMGKGVKVGEGELPAEAGDAAKDAERSSAEVAVNVESDVKVETPIEASEGASSSSAAPVPTSSFSCSPVPSAPASAPPPPSTAFPELTRHIATSLPSTIPPTHKLVYLSADAEEELTTLAEDEAYVIGGIVDRNRYKNLCQNKAERLGIRTARLPIGTYLANMPTRKVLTVNQVFEILSQYLALQDWGAAFEAVIPQRKYFNSKEEKTQSNKRARDGEAEHPGAAEGGAETGVEAGGGPDGDMSAAADVHPDADVSMGEEEALNG